MAESTRTTRNDKATIERHTAILKGLMAKPENKYCCDCKKKDPRWAAWNLGCFMCIRCSGVHRSLGTHISKVKSADLDTWTQEQIDNMVRWGNAKANAYWESELPKDMKIPESDVEKFIRAKYERKQYAAKGPIPDPESIQSGGSGVPVSASSLPKTAAVAPQASLFDAPKTYVPAPATQSSASDDLFAAFQSAPAAQSNPAPSAAINGSAKANILSLYNSPSSSPAKTNIPFANNSFANFGAPPQQQQTPLNFSPMQPLQQPQQHNNSFSAFGSFGGNNMQQPNNSGGFGTFGGMQSHSIGIQNTAANNNAFSAFGDFSSGGGTSGFGGSVNIQQAKTTTPGSIGGIPNFMEFSTPATAPSSNNFNQAANSDWGDFQ